MSRIIKVNGDKLVADFDAARRADLGSVSHAEQVRLALLATLGELGALTVSDRDVQYEGTRFVLPETFAGNPNGAIEYLQAFVTAQETPTNFDRTFNFRPWDGANAFQEALFRCFGTAGIGAATKTMFGTQPPEKHTVKTGVHTTATVPWAKVDFPPLNTVFNLIATTSRDYGLLFHLSAMAPRKYEAQINAFFDLVDAELRDRSIYKGKAITGGDEPEFLDLSRVDAAAVVYSDDVLTALETNVWALLKHTEVMRANGLPLKRAVLLEGPYGTGKSLAVMLTAQLAEANGWTFIRCRPGIDDLGQTLATAALYAPAVVGFEDIDVIAKSGANSAEEISALLDALDGMANKGIAVVGLFTTNHVEAIHQAVMRPGRLDAVIEVGALEPEALKRLVEILIPEDRRTKIDYEHVGNAFAGFLPAFAAEAITGALRANIARTNGQPGKIGTEDLVNSAIGLRRQLDLMQNAGAATASTSLESLIGDKVAEVISRTRVTYDGNGDEVLAFDAALEPVKV